MFQDKERVAMMVYQTNPQGIELYYASYLLGRSQRVSIADTTSTPRCLEYGVPQGLVARKLVSANRWLRGVKTYRFPWYLTQVSFNHASSNPGQGAILWPLLFTLYIAPLQDVIRSHGLDSMFYADDAQIHIAIDDPKHSVDSVEVLRGCINDVFAWNTKNTLKCYISRRDSTGKLHSTKHYC